MTEFTKHDVETAPENSRPIIEGVKKGLGFVPNLLGYMAESPELLKGYTTLSGIFDKTSLNAVERQVVLLTVSRLNPCHYCMAAHTSIAQMQKVPADVIRSLRDDAAIEDGKLEALQTFTKAMVEARGYVQQDGIDAFLEAGYTKQNVLEVVLGVGVKTLSNYTNHFVETEVDEAFSANAWQG